MFQFALLCFVAVASAAKLGSHSHRQGRQGGYIALVEEAPASYGEPEAAAERGDDLHILPPPFEVLADHQDRSLPHQPAAQPEHHAVTDHNL